MKRMLKLGVAALFLTVSLPIPAQNGYWEYAGTTFKNESIRQRVDLGSTLGVYDYEVWPEGHNLAFRRTYVGDYKVYHDTPDPKPGMSMNVHREYHNHKGEYASVALNLPSAPQILRPGETMRLTLKSSHSTSCGWNYEKLDFDIGTVIISVGSTQVGYFPTNTTHSDNFDIQIPNGAPGYEMPIRFTLGQANMGQEMMHRYVWKQGNAPSGSTGGGSMGGSTGSGSGDDEEIPSWVWWGGGALLLLLLFRKKK